MFCGNMVVYNLVWVSDVAMLESVCSGLFTSETLWLVGCYTFTRIRLIEKGNILGHMNSWRCDID